MFTILNVREGIKTHEDPGWYRTAERPTWRKHKG